MAANGCQWQGNKTNMTDPRLILAGIVVAVTVWGGVQVYHGAQKVGHAIVHVFKKK